MTVARRSHWKQVRWIMVPGLVLAVAIGWLILDGLRYRGIQQSRYALPSDTSARSLLDFMRRMDGSAQAESMFESSNAESVTEAIRAAYERLVPVRDSLSAVEQHEAEFYRLYHWTGSLFGREDSSRIEELDELIAATREFIAQSTSFRSRELQIAKFVTQVLEAYGRIDSSREFGQWIIEQIRSRPEFDTEVAKTATVNIEKVVSRLSLLNQRLELRSLTLDDRHVDMESLQGKVVLIEFWMPQCKPCMAELPALKRVYRKYKQHGFEIVGICLHAAPTKIASCIAEHQVPWVQLCDDKTASAECNQRLRDQFGIDALPTTLLLNQQGQVIAMGIRPLATDPTRNLEHWLKSLLKE